MQKGKIIEISASLESDRKSDETTRLFESIVKTVYENRNALKKGIVDCDVNSNNFAIITLNISKISKRKQKRYNLHRLFDGTFQLQRCSFCGCNYLSYISFSIIFPRYYDIHLSFAGPIQIEFVSPMISTTKPLPNNGPIVKSRNP